MERHSWLLKLKQTLTANKASVRHAEWRSNGCVCVCATNPFKHPLSALNFLFSSARSCRALMWVRAGMTTTTATIGSSANYLMSIFQLINCNCSAFDSRLAEEGCFVCARRRLPGACMRVFETPQVSLLLLIAIHCSFARHIFFSFFLFGASLLASSPQMSVDSNENRHIVFASHKFNLENEFSAELAESHRTMHLQFTYKIPNVFTLHIIPCGFSPRKSIPNNYL